jgi:CRP/FNR family cyclic AMP-dependent transcriptional regulator
MPGSSIGSLGQTYQDGQIIIKQGTSGDCLYVIQEGRVEVIAESEGREIKLAELGRSEFFGEMGLFEKDVRSSTVRSLGEARILTIDKKNFYQTIQKDPSLAFRLLETISHRLRLANQRIAALEKQLSEKD